MRRLIALAGVLLVAAHAAPAQSGLTLLREGNAAYEKSRYPDAEVSYRKALEVPGGPAAARFNLGDALYKQERYDEAASQFESAASSAGTRNDRAQAYHNLGNALLKGKKLEESIDAYKNALKLNPKDEDTRYNLEYAKRLLQQQQQQQQKQQQKQDKNDQQKKDEQKQDQREKDQQEQQQNQDRQQKEKQPPRQPKDQISKADAERILEALRQQEQDVKKKLQKKVPVRVRVEKDW